MSSVASRGLTALMLVSSSACGGRVVRQAKSPDGEQVAFAMEIRNIDGPDQGLGIKRGSASLDLGRLAPDNEACVSITWRQDGQQVAFVILGQDGTYLRVFDAASGQRLGRANLARPDVEIRRVELRNDNVVTFDACEWQTGCASQIAHVEIKR
jgi:hypothetical protein